MKNLSLTTKLLLAAVAFAVVVGVVAAFTSRSKVFGQTNITETKDLFLIGTASTPVALTSAYTGGGSASGTTDTVNFPHQAYFISYTPRSYASHMDLLIEGAPDKACTRYYPMTVSENTSGATFVYVSGTTGIPYSFPSGVTSASGTTYKTRISGEEIARCIKVSAKEVTTSTAGNLSVEGYFTSN